ncbi:MAG: hypothetical protein RIS59_291 [Pseudomonadota bacterium]
MCMRKVAVACALALTASAQATDLAQELLHTPLGKPLSVTHVPIIWPDGRGLPAGQGSVAGGERLYVEQCQACHGERGTGGSGGHLAGRSALAGPDPDRTVANYWPHATTVFDYIRRAMPPQAPWSLSPDDTYAVTAYVLHLGGLLPADAVLDAQRLATVRMPNREGFLPSGEAREAGAR